MRHEAGQTFGIFLMFLLISGILLVGVSPLRTSARTVTIPPQQQVVLHYSEYQYLEVDSFSNSTWLAYNITSTSPISVALMTVSQFNSFSNVTSDPISNSITYQNGTSMQQEIHIAPGQYFLVIYAYVSRAVVNIGYTVYPNTPFSYGAVTPPFASGIATYGIKNVSGDAIPYEVRTNEIIGVANISSFLVNNPNAASYGDNVAGATLQLNSILVVNESDGSQGIYWIQNTPDFVTSTDAISLTDNIWNNTDLSGILSNQSITSSNSANGAAVYISTTGGSTSYAYLNYENNMTYNLPYSFALLESETVLKGRGVLVQLGYRLLQNGSLSSSPVYWYDNVTINAPNVTTAYYDVSGNATTPIGSFFDSEFVFAGEGNYETTQLVTMSSSLGLFYKNETSGLMSSFPSYYSFGSDTGEAVTNASVTYKNGIAFVQPGNSNYAYLGESSILLGSDYRLPSFATPPLVTTTISPTTLTQVTSSVSTSNGGTSGSLPLVAGLVVLIFVLIGVVVVALRRNRPTKDMLTFPQTTPLQMSPSTCPYCGTLLPPEAAFCSNCGQPQQRQI